MALGLVHDRAAFEKAAQTALAEGVGSDVLELVDVALEGSTVRPEVVRLLEHDERGPLVDAEAAMRTISDGRDRTLALIARECARRVGDVSDETVPPPPGQEMEALVPRALIDKVFVLEEAQLFRGLSVDDLSAVAELCEESHAVPGEVFYTQGEPGEALFVILNGEVSLERDGKLLMDLSTGDSFGQVSLLDKGARPVTARAGRDGTDVLRLERGPFMDLIEDRPQIAQGLFHILARRLRELLVLAGEDGG